MDASPDPGPENTPPDPLPREGYPNGRATIASSVLQYAPPGWKSVSLAYRAVGRHAEAEAEAEMLEGSRVPWDLPAGLLESIRRVRLNQSGRWGTWHRLDLTVEFPTTVVSVDFDWYGEPEFRERCPLAEYRRELFKLYQAPDRLPPWIVTRSALPKNTMSRYTWAPGDRVEPVPAPEPPVQVSGPAPEGIVAALLPLLPEGWETVSYEVLVLGSQQEHQLLATLPDGTQDAPEIPLELIEAVAAQRSADHTRERGAWLGLTLDLVRDGASSMVLDYSTRPMWHQVPPDDVYPEELWNFPRTDEAIPTWLRWRGGLELGPEAMPAIPAALTEPQLQRTRATETVLAERKYHEPLQPEEIERVAAYLRGAPVVLTTAAGERDRVFPDRSEHVPLGYRTDGTWIWPQDAVYYLELDQVSPDPPLLKHIRELDYTVPDVSGHVLTAAYAQLIDWIEGPS
ncbi:hypothetical protein KDK95_02450 [Actinospica sp. MGRD01-02]|uniref:Uncharacterized protein n=1 Tax=Actinospica acidithermotolerans TaxID=2828514 RepID=A0A941E4U6_9ACTN|nr:hypothetical protein [Actinospica acidithermotolerans]MBR7825151.1 hypothetical protein [Actinospica acidithermotolerans]